MKLRNILVAAVFGVTSVAFSQTPPVQQTKNCDSLPVCSLDGTTYLYVNSQEGISITVPSQIDFHLLPGALVAGNIPLTAITTWYLDSSYSNIWVDAFFEDASNALQAGGDSLMGINIPANAILAAQGGQGAMVAFAPPASILSGTDPLILEGLAAAFPIKKIVLAGYTTVADPSGANMYAGQDSSYLNLWIDFRRGGPLYGRINPTTTGSWGGYVKVRAQAY